MATKTRIRNLTRKLVRRSKHFVHQAHYFGRAAIEAAKDHTKLWTTGMTAVLKMSTFFCVVPFTVMTDQSGSTLRIGTRRHLFKTRICSVIGFLRLTFFTYISLDENFKWLSSGLFTTDACFFVVWSLLSAEAYAIHVVLLYQKEDFVFLCNATSRLNKTFARMFKEQGGHGVVVTRMN